MITVKFRGGPHKGKYQNHPSVSEKYLVRMADPKQILTWSDYENPQLQIKYKDGHYAKTNIRTKTGAYVYQWMGWEGEVIAR